MQMSTLMSPTRVVCDLLEAACDLARIAIHALCLLFKHTDADRDTVDAAGKAAI